MNDTIGQTRKFIVKVSEHNLTGRTQALTVTKVLPAEAPQPVVELEENAIVPSPKETLQMGDTEDGSSIGVEEPADERVKRTAETMESEEAKRPKDSAMFYFYFQTLAFLHLNYFGYNLCWFSLSFTNSLHYVYEW